MDNPDPTQFITILAHKAALVDQQVAFDAVIASKQAEIERLTRVVESTPPAEPSPVAATITALHAAFSSTLPPEAQAAFAMPYAIVRVLVEAEQYALAAAVIQGIAVPPELEDAKQGLIALLPTT